MADSYGTGAKPIISGAGAADAILLSNVQYWELRNLDVTNTGPDVANRRGVHVRLDDFGTATYYRITNLTVRDVNGDLTKDLGGSAGIQFDVYGSAIQTRFADVIIQGNDISRVDRSGINMSSSWWCRASAGCSGKQQYVGWGAFIIQDNTVRDIGGDGIVVQYASGSMVQRNVGYDINQRSGLLNNAGFWVWNADNVTFQFNEVYRVKRPSGINDGNAFDADYGTDGTVFQYNFSHDNEGGMLLLCGCGGDSTNSVARYNVSQNDGSRIIAAAGGTSSFYNNTIFLSPGSTTAIVEQLAPTTVRLSNNIFYNAGTGGYEFPAANIGNYTFANNVFYGNHPTNEPADPGKITANPLLTSPGSGTSASSLSGYALQAGSPALAAGALLSSNGGRDYLGTAVPAVCKPDIGAFQRSTFNDAGCTLPSGNLAVNGGFETGALQPWTSWNGASLVTTPTHTGTKVARIGPAPASIEQTITVEPSTTYVLTGWTRSATLGEPTALGVKNYGGAETSATSSTTDWVLQSVQFTTGPSATSATIYAYKGTGGTYGYADDLQVRRSSMTNGGFEATTLTPWTAWNSASLTSTTPHSGAKAVQVGSAPASVEQIVSVTPNTTYLLTGWVRSATAAEQVTLGAKNFGTATGAESSGTATAWTLQTVQFTTGASATSATIYLYKGSGSGLGYGDDVTLTALS